MDINKIQEKLKNEFSGGKRKIIFWYDEDKKFADEISDFSFEPVQSPDEEIISKEEVAEINNAIEKLPPKCKHVFFLAKIEGLPYIKIAEMLEVSVQTVNYHIAYAIEALSKSLKIASPKKK